MSLSRYCGVVPSASNELIPQSESAAFKTSSVLNPVGVPVLAEPYAVITANLSKAPTDVVQLSIDSAGNLFSRRSTAIPSTWTAQVPAGAGGAGAVTSFNARVGAVVPTAGDYTEAEITNVPFGYVAAVNGQAAIDAIITQTTPITTLPGPGLVVETALNTFANAAIVGGAGITVTNGNGVGGNPTISFSGAPGGVSSFNARTGAVVPAANDYTEGQITNVPFGYVAAVDGQTAINDIITQTTPISTIAGSGILVQSAPNVFLDRSIVPGTGTTVVNGNGVAGNPAVSVDANLAALDTLVASAGTGFITQTAVGTVVDRSLAAGTGIAITNAAGVAGNPSIAVDASLSAVNTLVGGGGTGFMVQTGVNTVADRSLVAGFGVGIVNPNPAAGNPLLSFAASCMQLIVSPVATAPGGLFTLLGPSILGTDLSFTPPSSINILNSGSYMVIYNLTCVPTSGNVFVLYNITASAVASNAYGAITGATASLTAYSSASGLGFGGLTGGNSYGIRNIDIAAETPGAPAGGISTGAGNVFIMRLA